MGAPPTRTTRTLSAARPTRWQSFVLFALIGGCWAGFAALAISTADADDWPEGTGELARFVERERGLRFTEPVPIVWDAPDVIAADTETVFELPESGVTAAYRRLGLLPASSAEAGPGLGGASAYYDAVSGSIVMPDVAMDDWVRSVLVHELVHALQDQNGLLDAVVYDEEHYRTHRTLSEGDATNVEMAWWDDTDPGGELGGFTEAWTGDWEVAEAAAPYVLGRAWVGYLEALGGDVFVDELLVEPPYDRLTIVVPWYRGDHNVAWSTIEDELGTGSGEIVHEGPLGPVAIYALLEPVTGAQATRASLETYISDRLWLDGECVRAAVMFERAEHAEDFAEIVARTAAQELEIDGRVVRLLSCLDTPMSDPSRHGPGQLFPLVAGLDAAAGLHDPVRERCATIQADKAMPEMAAEPSADQLDRFWAWNEVFRSTC